MLLQDGGRLQYVVDKTLGQGVFARRRHHNFVDDYWAAMARELPPSIDLPSPDAHDGDVQVELATLRNAVVEQQQTIAQQTQTLAQQTQLLTALREEMQLLRQAVLGDNHSALATAVPAAPPLLKSRSTFSNTSTKGDTFLSAALKRAFPMFVLPIQTLLSPSFQKLRPHEELRAAGALVEWHLGMAPVLFVSHTWLRHRHPDSEAGDKFKTLVGVLQRIMSGELNIVPGWLVKLIHGREAKSFHISAAALRRDLMNGFIFFDYMSIPQAADATEAQQRAIASLVSYVSDSAYFFVLAGAWTHENGSHRDEIAWAGRGWCRMELTANMLSPVSKPMIVCRSPSSIESFPPGGLLTRDFLSQPVGKGKFTVDSDAHKLAPHLQHLISARKAQALAEGDVLFFRVLHASTARLLEGTDIRVEPEPFTTWMAAMRFESVHDGKKTGLTPLFFALLAIRRDLVAELLDRGAEIDLRLRISRPQLNLQKGQSMLGFAASLATDPEIMQMLLRQGANPRAAIDKSGRHDTALMSVFVTENIMAADVLISHDPELLLRRNQEMQYPLEMAAGFGKMLTLLHINEHHPEAVELLAKAPANWWGCSRIGFAILNNAGSVDLINFLLDSGEPVDLCGHVPHQGIGKLIHLMDFASRFKSLKSLTGFWVIPLCCRATALQLAAFLGNMGALKVLIERGANIENRGLMPRKMTPLHMAVLGGHNEAVSVLLEAGARTDAKDSAGRTPADLAKCLGHQTIRQRLQQASHHYRVVAPASARVLPRHVVRRE